MTREELWLAAIAGLDGVNPPDYPVWHYEQMLAAIYDAVVGAADPRPFPERSWHLDEFLWAVYCAVAGLADPGIPAPTCRIEEFWQGIYLKAMNDEDAAVPTPVWRIEEFLAEVFNNLTTAELKTVTGTMLHVLDALAKPAEELVATLSPIQDLHGYDSPWPGGGGKNKWNPTTGGIAEGTYNGITYTKNNDGSYSFSGTATGSTWLDFGNVTLPSGTWTASVTQTGSYTGAVAFGANNGAFITYPNLTTYPRTVTSESETTGKFGVNFANGTAITGTLTLWIQIESGSPASSWEPYENICPISGRTGVSVYVSPTQDQQDATTYAVDWTSEAGTVYGGTLDVVTGVLTVEYAKEDMGSLSWGYVNGVFYASLSANSYKYSSIVKSICSMYNFKGTEANGTASVATKPNGSYLLYYNSNYPNSRVVYVKDEAYTTAVAFTTAVTGQELVYELATPLTYQLTGQEVEMLLRENNLWADGGETLTLTYYADGNANAEDALNLLLGNRYVNNHTPEDVSDREALDILLGR